MFCGPSMVPSLMASPHANRPRAQGHSRISLILTGRPGDWLRRSFSVVPLVGPSTRHWGDVRDERPVLARDRRTMALPEPPPLILFRVAPGGRVVAAIDS